MKQMIHEYNSEEYNDIPIPIKAGILAYQFVTTHPFWDGNGRCARLLATFILKSYGYDLKGFYVLEDMIKILLYIIILYKWDYIITFILEEMKQI